MQPHAHPAGDKESWRRLHRDQEDHRGPAEGPDLEEDPELVPLDM